MEAVVCYEKGVLIPRTMPLYNITKENPHEIASQVSGNGLSIFG